MKYKLHSQETITKSDGITECRMVVPGGWLYQTLIIWKGVPTITQCFIPDPSVEIEE